MSKDTYELTSNHRHKSLLLVCVDDCTDIAGSVGGIPRAYHHAGFAILDAATTPASRVSDMSLSKRGKGWTYTVEMMTCAPKMSPSSASWSIRNPWATTFAE